MGRKQAIKKWLWYFSIAAAAILLYKLYDNFGQALGVVGNLIGILAPFVGGLVLAFLLYRPSYWMERTLLRLKGKWWPRLARPLALIIVYLLLLGIIAGVVLLLIPAFSDSITELSNSLPGYIAAAQQKIQEWDNSEGWLAELKISEQLNNVYAYLTEAVAKMMTIENLSTALKSVGAFGAALLDVLIAFIVSIYMLSGREHLLAAVKNLLSLFFKPKTLAVIGHYGYRSAHIFGNYFYGALLDSLCVGIVVSIGLMLFGVPFAPLLGMVLGLMNIIPYFGAIIGCIGVALVTLLTTNFYTAIGVTVYLVVIQQLDGNILQPRLVGQSVGLRPIYVLLSVTLFGGLFGFWGIFLAPPIMAIIQMFVRDATKARKAREAAAAEASSPTTEETPE